ncbi:MAG TPA: amino acid adenylation domain-containing protein, partial [Longimicrobium sp.]|nr:amino acid adenylation domain-containing protein [Longimicrobium sp.]
VFHSTPTVYRHLAAQLADGHDLSRIRIVVLGGEETVPADVETFRRRFSPEALFVNGMGPTECTVALQHFVDQRMPVARGPVPVGYPVDGVEARLLNAAGEPVETYATGEITLRSAHVALGYWRRPEQTAAAFLPDPDGGEKRIYRTGDFGRMLPDGSIAFAGRRDGQVKIRGVRIETGEVESVIRAHPQVSECAVVAREDGGEKRLVAYVVGDADAAALRAHVRAHLPESMTPSAFVSIERLPLTPNGKLDRRALPAPVMEADEDAYVAPATPTQEIVAAIWGEVLGRERVGAHDGFFDLGGHSLLATRVVSRIRDAFGVELPLRAIFEAPTVAGLAERVDAMLRGGDRSTVPPVVPVPRDGPLPLSFAQQRLWFLDQLEPGGSAYNLGYALRLAGVLDVDALERSLAEIVRRHEVLRTRFPSVDGEAVQVIDPAGPVRIERVDLMHLPEAERLTAERLTAARELAAREQARPFDLAAGPLLRCTLVRLADDDHALLITLHHIVSDGWSTGVLVREASALYGAFSGGAASPLSDLPIKYADFAAWQRAWLSGEVLDAQVAYWRARLAGAPPLLEIPTDRPRPQVPSGRGAAVPFTLSAQTTEALRALSRRQGATLFMSLLAGWQLLLSKYSGQPDVSVGSPIAGRTRVETEGLIGSFVNTLVLRTDLSGAPTFRDVIGRVREVTLGAYQHQDVPFEKLVEELAPERSLSHTPLFQALLTLQNNTRETLALGSLAAEPLGGAQPAAQFDLALSVADTAAGLAGGLTYRTDLFDRATAERMVEHLRVLLEEMAAHPERRTDSVELLRGAERARVLGEWNATDADYAADRCIHHLIEAQAARTPDAPAVVFGGETVTYRELDERANRLAHRLGRLGAGPEVRVGISLERSAEMVVAILAVLKSGAAYVPLDPAYPAERVAFMLEDSHASVLVTQARLLDRFAGAGTRTVCVDEDAAAIVAQPARAPRVRVDARNAAYVIYTSGSTGRPKGVVVPHAAVSAFFTGMDERVGGTVPGTWLAVTRISFDIHVLELLWTLACGFRVVVQPEAEHAADGETLARQIRRHAVTHLQCTPSLAAMLVAESGVEALSGLERLLLGGEALPADLAAQVATVLHGRLVNLYGPTETTVWSATHAVEAGQGIVPIGRPIANTRVYVLDAALRPQPAGVPGELFIGGAGVTRGYLRRPALTAERFIPDAFSGAGGARLYRTGDRARWLHDGTLEYLGRLDEQVKVRGFRIEPGEIETVLRRCEGVRECAVVVREHAPGDRRLVAYVAGGADAEALRAALRRTLPDYMVPSAFVALDALPLTPNGKLDRRALPAPVMEADEDAYVAPATPTEELLAGLFADVLGVESVGARDDFFALGGHSLLATRVVSRIRAAFGADLPLRVFFRDPTAAALAAWLREHRGGEGAPPPIERVARPGVWLPLSFAQQRLWVVQQLDADSRVYNHSLGFRLSGRLDVDALERAVTELVRRHAVLRTRFVSREGVAGQVIDPPAEVPLRRADVSGEADPEAALAVLAAGHERELFDLAAGPLLRVLLVRMAPDEHALLATLHHIVTDGWSSGILYREVAELYRAFSAGRPSPLPEPPVQYADFAAWQRGWLTPEREARQLDFWRERLAGAPRLHLAADVAREAEGTDGGTHHFQLPAGLSREVRALGRSLGATPFMTLLAAYKVLLRWQGGGDDVVVGTDIANRNQREETERLIGFFVNQLVLRTRLDDELTFAGLVARVREVTLSGYDHQDVPFDRVVDALRPERAPGETPFFRTKFVLQNAPRAEVQLPGLVIRPLPVARSAAQLDVLLAMAERAEGIAGWFEYRTARFSPGLMVRWGRRFQAVLEEAVADPGRTLAALAARLNADERAERQQAQEALKAKRRARFTR